MSFRHLTVTGTPLIAPAASPCVNICVIEEDGLCVGCARTLDEIASWGGWSAAERSAVMLALPARRKQNQPK